MKTILLTASIEKHEITEALRLGARGIILKDTATQLLVKSVRCVVVGQYWIGRDNVAGLIQALQMADTTPKQPTDTYGLTPREREVITAIVAGFSNKEIAQKFAICER